MDIVQLRRIIRNCNTRTEFALKLGYKYYNGRVKKIIDLLIQENDLNESHFDSFYTARKNAKYKKIVKICPVCNAEFETKEGHRDEKTVCSTSCSNTYFYNLKYNLDSNKKRSITLKKDFKDLKRWNKTCVTCGKDFETKKKTQVACSRSCSSKNNWTKNSYRKTITGMMNKKVANGTHSGWKSRAKMDKSFPEKYTISILNDLKINYESEYRCGRWFIDFADVDKKIAFEVDGKQHDYPDRKKKDQIKDAYLIKNGWTVVRYRWKGIKTKEDREKYIQFIKGIFK